MKKNTDVQRAVTNFSSTLVSPSVLFVSSDWRGLRYFKLSWMIGHPFRGKVHLKVDVNFLKVYIEEIKRGLGETY